MENEIIEISTPEQLQAIATDVSYRNEDGHITGDFILTNDIDLESIINFIPIGTEAIPFIGTLHGNQYTIKNLTINRPAEDHVGLFGYIMFGAAIRNVKIEGGTITGNSVVGGLVGSMTEGTVTGYNTGDVIGNGGDVGGLVGDVNGGIVRGSNAGNVTNTGRVSGKYGYVGGLVGSMWDGIVTGYNTGVISGGDYSRIGGLIGWMDAGEVSGYNTRVISGGLGGGLIGYMIGGRVTGYVKGFTNTHIGENTTVITGSLPEITCLETSCPVLEFGSEIGQWIDRSSEGEFPDINI